jgi:hypothetical protein
MYIVSLGICYLQHYASLCSILVVSCSYGMIRRLSIEVMGKGAGIMWVHLLELTHGFLLPASFQHLTLDVFLTIFNIAISHH